MEVEPTPGGRFRQVREHYRLSRKELAALLRISQPMLSYIENGQKNASENILLRMEKYLGTNPDFIAAGTLPMLLNEVDAEALAGLSAGGYTLRDAYAIQEPEAPRLQMADVDVFPEDRVIVVPHEAMASYVECFNEPRYINELETEAVPPDLQQHGPVARFAIYGESMEPTLLHDDHVYCSLLRVNDRMALQYNLRNDHLYVVVSRTGIYIKRCSYIPGDSYLVMHSDNPDRKAYPPVKMPLMDILQLWYVRRGWKTQFPKPAYLEGNLKIAQLEQGLSSTNSRLSSVAAEVADLQAGLKEVNRAVSQMERNILEALKGR